MARVYMRGDATWTAVDEGHLFLDGVAGWSVPDLTIDENPFSITFETLANVDLASGIWNKSKSRLEC